MITVKNKHDYQMQEGDVYIGRPGIFGNPNIPKEMGVGETLAKYEIHMRKRYAEDEEFRSAVTEQVKCHQTGEAITLVCWCKPAPCHGDVLKAFIEELSIIDLNPLLPD